MLGVESNISWDFLKSQTDLEPWYIRYFLYVRDFIINYYYKLHIYPGYPHHLSVFQWGPANPNLKFISVKNLKAIVPG